MATATVVPNNKQQLKEYAVLALCVSPLLSAAFVCRYGAKGARQLALAANAAASKLEAADASCTKKAQEVR